MSILKLVDVRKTYGDHVAVNDVSFEMPRGCVFGLLGPNGAGKTSLIRIITTITRADQGQVFLDEEPLNNLHPTQIGYMPEERGLYKKMRVGEHLLYLAQLKGMTLHEAKQQSKYWFEKFDIVDWWEKRIEELSKGMQQKIQFIATVIHQPKLLILDEPFSGLDPINTRLIKNEIDELHHKGVSIIFSTHRMEQVEEVCEHIVLINQGQNVLEGTVVDVKNQFKENIFEVNFEGALPDNIENYGKLVLQKGNTIRIKLENVDSNIFLKHLLDNEVTIHSFNEILPSLNEIFIKQVNEPHLVST